MWKPPVLGAALAVCMAVVLLPGCQRRPPATAANPHYVVGAAWRGDGVWFYPDEAYKATQTGIAQIDPRRHAPLTADSEAYDPDALAASHQTLPLPAIARVTDLDNGRQIEVRINDRGPPNPARLISVTPRAATLLGMTGPARVRLEVLHEETQAAIEGVGGAPKLALVAAPVGSVQVTDLPPPGQTAPPQAAPFAGSPVATPVPVSAAALTRLPQRVLQGAPEPGRIALLLGTFTNAGPAGMQAAAVPGLAPRIERERTGRSVAYTVIAGPYDAILDADAALDQAIRAGVTGARLVIEAQSGGPAD
ncbi:MAG TPA: RlpA-like double-psi beta-barrel domain-containing protein [Acidisphaera sp.]|nr:RlpA-like double-psi beta-barrel domain-containing protein [Acidisphaera sp.]